MFKYRLVRVMPLLLAAALQIMPLLRSMVPTVTQGLTPSAWSIILKIGAGAVALMGSYHAVSGASVTISPVNVGNIIYLTNGLAYKRLLGTSPLVARSWSINGLSSSGTAYFQLFPNFSLTNANGYIAGTPVLNSGINTNHATITAWEGSSDNQSSTSTGFTFIVFSAIPGSVAVNLSPTGAVAAANSLTWNIDGGAWQTNNTTNIFVLPGSHVINYTNLAGWIATTGQTVTVTSSTLTTLTPTFTPLYGGLQVNVQPVGTPLQTGLWSVDGSGSYPSGTVTNVIASGTHSVTFSAVSGYNTAATQTITVTNGATNVITAVYLNASSGNLLVNIGPPGANTAGAMWQVDNNGIWLPAGAATNLPSGSHTISYSSIAGWTTPNSQVVSTINGLLTRVTGTYVAAPTGGLQVNLSPAGAVTAGAQWQVDGGALQSSGAVVTGLTGGSHTVAFKAVSGWLTPGGQTPAVTSGTTNIISGTYVQIAAPVITNFTVSGTSLVLKGSGTSGAGFSMLTTNNPTLPHTNWPVIFTGTITNGTFIYNGTSSPAAGAKFYRVSSQ